MRRLRALCSAAALGAASTLAWAAGSGPYDPATDANEQIEAAGRQAQATNRRVLVVVGGNWCKWCRALDGLIAENGEVRGEIERRFVVVHVNYSKENKNPAVMERLGNPDKLGFPVLVVLSPALEVLHAQETGSLETGDPETPGHDPGRIIAFARSWGPGEGRAAARP